MDTGRLGEATGLAATAQWLVHMVMPLATAYLATYSHYVHVLYVSVAMSIATLAFVTGACHHLDTRVGSVLPLNFMRSSKQLID